MTSVDEVLDDFEDDDVYYDPEQSITIEEGTYPARVTGLDRHKIKTKRGEDCIIYKPVYTIDGSVIRYANQRVYDSGVWRFYGTKNESGHRITGKGNESYKKFMDKMNIEMAETEIDGKRVFKLPTLTKDMILDRAVTINVSHREWQSRFGRRVSPEATLIHSREPQTGG